ncbi:hypothetical protein ACFB49_48620 [Sphingomonas sp. DBB INV C78]|uniref:PilZ domain-containing protein n=1 Tax=Sphingomonas sp. DBB INV C78 TaxID=3349434 RepID=UPI0036D25F9C
MTAEAVALGMEPATPAKYDRRHGRYRVLLSARLHSPLGASTAVLLDISEGGALVSCPAPIAQGTHVVLTRGHMQVHGRVARVEGRRLGVEFDAPIDSRLVADVVTPIARWAN